ncbi:hypothetical protein BASA83_013766 [Batrachochytrium salamandrivorans]|nr:hypothetical protein BASA83_013766 [Batrachochytrium salamandrivorans]
MKFNVLVVSMVITSVNASGKERFLGWFRKDSGISKSKSNSDLSLLGHEKDISQDLDPNEKKTTCDNLEFKLHLSHDRIDARNLRVRLNIPELYKIIKGNRGMRTWRTTNGVRTE